MKEVVGDSIIIWWLEQFCDPSFLSTVKMAWVDRGYWVDNLFILQCVLHLAGRCCCDYMVRQEIKKSCQLNTLSTHAIFTVLFFTGYTVPHANQKMFFSCTYCFEHFIHFRRSSDVSCTTFGFRVSELSSECLSFIFNKSH